MQAKRAVQQKKQTSASKSRKRKRELAETAQNDAGVLDTGKANPQTLSRIRPSLLQRTLGNQQLARTADRELVHPSQAWQDVVQRVITLPPIQITGDPNFYPRAQRLNQHYAANPPIAGWPYDATLTRLWQSGQHDDFADKVRELQETRLGLTGRNADGVLGPQTARLLTGGTGVQEPAPSPPTQATVETKQAKMAHVMNLLVNKYGYPVNGAAGMVGNLYAESGLMPNRVEGSRPATPMRAKDVQDRVTDFTPEDVMNRKYGVQGPKKPGIGLAQWTTAGRRRGLFEHQVEGQTLGAAILNNLDAQVDYLVTELQSKYKGVNQVLKNAQSVEEASDEVLFNFERPAAVLKDKTDQAGKKGKGKTLRSRDDPAVQPVLKKRRTLGREARAAFQTAK